MEANDDRVAAALSGSKLAPTGSDVVLAEWRDRLERVFEDHDSELLRWP